MQRDLIISGDIEIMNDFTFKSGKKAVKLLDRETGKVIKIIVNSVLNVNGSGVYKVVGLKFYKDGFDILEVAGEVLQGLEEDI